MKLAVVVACADAPDSAFVVWRDLERSICKAAEYGYDGVELALCTGEEFDPEWLQKLLGSTGQTISLISTGQVFSRLHLTLSHPDKAVRQSAVTVMERIIGLAGTFGKRVNIGRVRGSYGDKIPRMETERLFLDSLSLLAARAAALGVELVIEPVNRYEGSYINNLGECAAQLRRFGGSNVGIMPDLFHMNIEEADIIGSLEEHMDRIRYIHFADSNRHAPGCGHIDFPGVLAALSRGGYDGWAAVEILPCPDPDTAAKQAINYLRPLLAALAEAQGREANR